MRWNPYSASLWLIGVVFIGAGAGLRVWTASFYYGPNYALRWGPELAFLSQLADMMVLPLLMVGFATIAGLLFLHARNRAQRVAGRR